MAPPTERRKKAVKRRTAKKRDVSTKRSSKRCTTSFSSHHPRAPSSHETLGPCREIPRAVSNACACRDSASPDIRPDETMEDGEQRIAGKSSMSLQWVKPPIKTYRARYKNELSKRGNCRGALEDETGDAWPVVKLTGYGEREAVHLDVSATTSDGQSHPLFFCKTAGRDAPTSCHGVPLSDGSQALRFVLRPEQENTCDLKHIGVVRLQREAGGDSGRLGLAASQTNYFNLTVTAHIPHQSTPVTLQSGAIKCISSTQAVSKPVVTQVLQLADRSAAGASVKVLAMGKDFLPSTHFRVFQQRADKSVWQVTIPPEECVVHCTHNCVIQFTMPQPPSDVIRMGPSKDLKVFIDAGSNTTRRSISSVPLSEERAFLFQYPIASAFHGKSSNRTASLPITSVSPMTSPMTSQPPSTVNDYTKSFTNQRDTCSVRATKKTIQDFLPTVHAPRTVSRMSQPDSLNVLPPFELAELGLSQALTPLSSIQSLASYVSMQASSCGNSNSNMTNQNMLLPFAMDFSQADGMPTGMVPSIGYQTQAGRCGIGIDAAAAQWGRLGTADRCLSPIDTPSPMVSEPFSEQSDLESDLSLNPERIMATMWTPAARAAD